MIARESGGSPYFVYELVEHLNAGGELEDRSQHPRLDLARRRPVGADRAPAGRARGRSWRSSPSPASRSGQADTIRAAGLGPEGFAALASLRSNHLIRGTGSGALDDVETYHDRIRETIVNRLDPGRLKHWHERLAVALEGSGRADAETLAVHFDAAEHPEKAGDYYIRAARAASQALAFDRAARLFRRALELRRRHRRGARPAPRAGAGTRRRRAIARGGPRVCDGLRGRRARTRSRSCAGRWPSSSS